MVGFCINKAGVRPGMEPGGPEAAVKFRLTVTEPEGNIDSRDFLHLLLLRKELRQKRLAAAQLQESSLSILSAGFEGDHAIGLQSAAEPAGQDGGIAAVGTEGGCSVIVGDQLAAAGIADEASDLALFLLAPLRLLCIVPLDLRFFFRYLGFRTGLDRGEVEHIVTVLTFHLLVLGTENQGCIAAGTFVFQNRGLAVQIISLLSESILS